LVYLSVRRDPKIGFRAIGEMQHQREGDQSKRREDEQPYLQRTVQNYGEGAEAQK
jgi:hypothetical protein